MRNASQHSPDDRERAYRMRLKDEALPAVIIDCATAVVLATNAGGLQALGLTPADRFPVALDSAMPAVAALRDLQRLGPKSQTQTTLVFWRRGRTSTRLCNVQAANPESPTHLAVLFLPDQDDIKPRHHDASGQHPAAQVPDEPTAANDDAPETTPRIVRDDSETLKEIARRIREGQRTRINDEYDVRDDKAITEQANEVPAPLEQSAGTAVRPTFTPERSEAPRSARERAAPLPADTPNQRALTLDDIAKLAHELKTPLSAIAAAAEIMRDERLGAMGNDKYLGYAADIHDSATHTLTVISEMLAASPADMASLGQGLTFDMSELAARTVSSLQPLAAQRSLSLSLDAEAGPIPVRASATAVRQILLNLLTNALKFTPPGGEVRVATGYLDDGAVFLVVRDTGDGMSEAALTHAFTDEPENVTARPGGGRGIGLRLVRRLTAENGADFEIDTAPGQGTVVLIAFAKDLVGGRY
jgi:signal transduction histidine kinase